MISTRNSAIAILHTLLTWYGTSPVLAKMAGQMGLRSLQAATPDTPHKKVPTAQKKTHVVQCNLDYQAINKLNHHDHRDVDLDRNPVDDRHLAGVDDKHIGEGLE